MRFITERQHILIQGEIENQTIWFSFVVKKGKIDIITCRKEGIYFISYFENRKWIMADVDRNTFPLPPEIIKKFWAKKKRLRF
jgi:hypothetical protein